MRFALDTLVALYTVGGPSPYRDASRRLVARLADGDLVAEASAELVPEYVVARARRTGDWPGALEEGGRWLELLSAHPLESRDLERAARLAAKVRDLDGHAALHAATCLNRGIPVIVSPDGRLDAVDGLRRVDPRDAEAYLIPTH